MHELDKLEFFVNRLEELGAPYMVTGATAAIIYGQPRMTNDLDVVLSLNEENRARLLRLFPEDEFYAPPESVIRAEQGRSQRGHFNLIHHESGYKADIYLAASEPLHVWALPLRRRIAWGAWGENPQIWVAPPEYVVLRKLQFFREGGSAKHPADIRAIVDITGVDEQLVAPWLASLGLEAVWNEIRRG
jgi:hypothetical protein